MLADGLWYLAGASFCLAALALAHRLLLARLPAFAWNRACLLGALAAGALLPLAARPGLAALLPRAAGAPAAARPFALHWPLGAPAAAAAAAAGATASAPGPDWAALALGALAVAYGLGALRRLVAAGRNLGALRRLARRHPRTRLAGCTVVHLPTPGLPAFSFGRCVFLSPLHEALGAAERAQLLRHEQVHVRQRHTLAGTDVVSLYMDHGYLFFRVTPAATRQPAGTVDLAFAVAEGRLARLRRAFVTGALTELARAALLKRLPLRAGDAFSRAQLIETNRLLAQDGRFDPQKIGLNPQPVPRPTETTDLVDIELALAPKPRP